MQTTSFLPKVVCPHALEELNDPVRALEEAKQETDRLNRDLADGEMVLEVGEMEDEKFPSKVLQPARLEDERERG